MDGRKESSLSQSWFMGLHIHGNPPVRQYLWGFSNIPSHRSIYRYQYSPEVERWVNMHFMKYVCTHTISYACFVLHITCQASTIMLHATTYPHAKNHVFQFPQLLIEHLKAFTPSFLPQKFMYTSVINVIEDWNQRYWYLHSVCTYLSKQEYTQTRMQQSCKHVQKNMKTRIQKSCKQVKKNMQTRM